MNGYGLGGMMNEKRLTQGDVVLVTEPLRSIIENGDVVALTKFHAEHPNVDLAQPYDSFKTPSLAFHAVELRHLAMVQYFIEEGGVDISVPGLHGATLLHLAVRRGFTDIVQLLVERLGAPVDAIDNLGWAPLHDAAMESNYEMVEYLVQHKCDISIATGDAQTAEALARSNDQPGETRKNNSNAQIAEYLKNIALLGGCNVWLRERRMEFVKLRWLTERQRALPIYVLARDTLALARFIFPSTITDNSSGEEIPAAEKGQLAILQLPRELLPLVIRFLVPLP
jgi:hypothetical protein